MPSVVVPIRVHVQKKWWLDVVRSVLFWILRAAVWARLLSVDEAISLGWRVVKRGLVLSVRRGRA